jgi:hypothetical protein
MIKNTIQLMTESKVIAQSLTPIDTGNLRYNAIRAYKTPTGFRIAMLYTAAFYGAILNEYGVRGGDTHKGWWSTGVYTAVSNYIHSSLNNRQSTYERADRTVAKFAPDNLERQAKFYNSMVADEGREKFLAGK